MASKTGFQVDVWAGDLHRRHIGVEVFSSWKETSEFMAEHVEIGHLCNVLHTDFTAPESRRQEAKAKLAESYLLGEE